ncbi:hypothetical protein Clacol_003146 [Clathrus columnatus]|uniref:Uncharacterized protein n=1 Tax=Clathrus columnatus TaxID=1419009 RepID=A0AAV5A2N7_9AGAM|nr:hypothetical protein Clacol_003146 [Clathrus columnatus]
MRSFVYNRNIPGGPVGYQQGYSNLPFSYAALLGFTSATWLQDGFLQIPIPLVFYCLTVGLNATLGGLIIYQLLKDRKELAETLGNYRTKLILNNVDIIIEGGIMYSIVGIVLIISFRLDPAIATGIEGLYGPLTALTSHLIAYRMVKGTAWSRDAVYQVRHDYARILNKDPEIQENEENTQLLSLSERFVLREDE